MPVPFCVSLCVNRVLACVRAVRARARARVCARAYVRACVARAYVRVRACVRSHHAGDLERVEHLHLGPRHSPSEIRKFARLVYSSFRGDAASVLSISAWASDAHHQKSGHVCHQKPGCVPDRKADRIPVQKSDIPDPNPDGLIRNLATSQLEPWSRIQS